MQIKELSQLSGMSSSSIRFYEEQGLLPSAERSPNGYRTYSSAALVRIQMIARAKDLGFTLKEIRELASLLYSRQLSETEMSRRLKQKNLEIEAKIKSLDLMKREIDKALKGLCEYRENLEHSIGRS